MKPRITALLACLLFAFHAPIAALGLQPKPPGPVVTTGNANLRAKPSMNAEILVSLKKDTVLVSLGDSVDPKAPADEPKEWVSVAAPAGTKVWVFAALVDPTTKTIRPAKANLRAGPGRNYAEVGYALQGTAVQELRSADGWIQIAAPEGAVIGYIAKSLTKSAPEQSVAPTPVAKVPATNSTPAIAGSSTPRRPVPLPSGSSKPSIAPGRSVPSDANVAPQPLNPKPAPVRRPSQVDTVAQAVPDTLPQPEPTPTPPAAEPIAIPSTPEPPAIVPSQPEITHTDKPRVVIREGIVGLATSPQAPGDYQLNNFRKGEGMIGFLHTDNPEIKLSSWRWRRVLITGEEYIDARWPKSALIKVTAIQPAY